MEKQLFVHGNAQGEGVPGAPEWARVVGHSDVRHQHGFEVTSNGPGDLLIAAGFTEPNANGLPPILLPEDAAPGHGAEGREAVPEPHRAPGASSPAVLVCLDKTGREKWRRRFGVGVDNGPEHRREKVPALAMSSDGSAWLAGRLHLQEGAAPTLEAARDWSLAALDPHGAPLWCKPLPFVDPHTEERPRVAAHPDGGTAIASYDRARGALFVVRCDDAGRVLWTQRIAMSGPHEGTIADLGIGTDQKGQVTAWGRFWGTLLTADSPTRAEQFEQARFVLRFDAQGALCWARKLAACHSDDARIAVLGSGRVIVAERAAPLTDEPPNSRTLARLPTMRDLVISILGDTQGDVLREVRYTGGPHTIISRAVVAPTGAHGFVCGGYFNGEIYVSSKQSIRSGNEEWMFLGDAKTWWRAFRGTSMQGGLRVLGDAGGAKIVCGWFGGTIEIGCGGLTSTEGAGLFVARFGT